MLSTCIGQRQGASTWRGLPGEIRRIILHFTMHNGSTLSRLATVCREWQMEIEPHNFARIRLTRSRLVEFNAMVQRNRSLVSYIWFCLELDDYDCTTCSPAPRLLRAREEHEEALAINDTYKRPITKSFQILFSSLSTWEHHGDLTLDISIYSPSDSEHWFKYLTFVPDTPPNLPLDYRTEEVMSAGTYDDLQHGWVAGFRQSAPPVWALKKVFHTVMERVPFDDDQEELQWWDGLPSVPAVTGLLFRQQNRRRWELKSLARMFTRFPRLQEVHYEPWRECNYMQKYTDMRYEYFFESIRLSNASLKRLVLFENFNQQYTCSLQFFMEGVEMADCETIRNPTPAVSRAVALTSLKLEHLAASFIVDAGYFFEIQPSWEWPNLRSLALTSKALTPDENATNINAVLQSAALAAMRMPRLETLEIWNGRKGLAGLFRYQAFPKLRHAVVLWRGTWDLALEPSMIQAWESVMHQYDGRRLDVVQERMDETDIKSHGDALQYLKLSCQVIRPISLQQIQREQKALEGVESR